MDPFIVPTQRLVKNVTAATNTRARIEELLDASLCMQSVSYQRDSVGLSVYLRIVTRQRLGKHAPKVRRKCWRSHFLCRMRRINRNYAISSSQNFLIL
jgi:hypothetical protein